MIKETITIQDAINLLNEAVKLDPEAVTTICRKKVPVNKELADHPTIQVNENGVGLLGFINGLFGIDDNGYGAIFSQIDDDGKIIKFGRRI